MAGAREKPQAQPAAEFREAMFRLRSGDGIGSRGDETAVANVDH
jgi:hypothetical protein